MGRLAPQREAAQSTPAREELLVPAAEPKATAPEPVKPPTAPDPLSQPPGMQLQTPPPAPIQTPQDLQATTQSNALKALAKDFDNTSALMAAAERSATQRIREEAKIQELPTTVHIRVEEVRTPKVDISMLVVVTTETTKAKVAALAHDAKHQEERPSPLFSRPSEKPEKDSKVQEPQKSAILEPKPNELKPLAEQRPFENRERPLGLVQEKPPPDKALEAVRDSKQERVTNVDGIKRVGEQTPLAPPPQPQPLSPSLSPAPATANSAPHVSSPAALSQPTLKIPERQSELPSQPQSNKVAAESAAQAKAQVVEKSMPAPSTRIEVIRVESPAEHRPAAAGAPRQSAEISPRASETTTRVVLRAPSTGVASSPIEVVYRFVAAVRERFAPSPEINQVRHPSTPRSASAPDSRIVVHAGSGEARSQNTLGPTGTTLPRSERILTGTGTVHAQPRSHVETAPRPPSSRGVTPTALGREAQPRLQDRATRDIALPRTGAATSVSRASSERAIKVQASHQHTERKQSQAEARRTVDILRQEKTTIAGTRITRVVRSGQVPIRAGSLRERLVDKLRFSDGTPVEKVVREVARAVKNLFQPLAADSEIAPVVTKESDFEETPKEHQEMILEPEHEREEGMETEHMIPQNLEKERFPKLDPLKDEPIAIYTIRGNVFDNDSGKPQAGVVIRSGLLGTTTTDGNGNYSFENVPEGTFFIITAHARGVRFHPGFASGTVSGHTTRDFRAIVLSH